MQPLTRRQEIRSFGILQTSKFVAVLYLVLFAVVFGIMAIFGLLAALFTGDTNAIVGGVIGFIALALLGPIFYGVMGFVFTALTCWIYNLVTGWIGGIELELTPPTHE